MQVRPIKAVKPGPGRKQNKIGALLDLAQELGLLGLVSVLIL
jgi:hypothetical protein